MSRPFSAAMLISRPGLGTEAAVQSVVRQAPDDLKFYVDPEVLPQVAEFLESTGGEVLVQESGTFAYGGPDHHAFIVEQVHRALCDARYQWLRWCDDDDAIAGDTRDLLSRHADADVAAIHGDVLANNYRGTHLRRAGSIERPAQANLFRGSCNLYNTELFRRIHTDLPEPIPDHGYFWDWKIIYFLTRAGYRTVYVPEVMTLQYVNPRPEPGRKRAVGTWPEEVARLDRIAWPR